MKDCGYVGGDCRLLKGIVTLYGDYVHSRCKVTNVRKTFLRLFSVSIWRVDNIRILLLQK